MRGLIVIAVACLIPIALNAEVIRLDVSQANLEKMASELEESDLFLGRKIASIQSVTSPQETHATLQLRCESQLPTNRLKAELKIHFDNPSDILIRNLKLRKKITNLGYSIIVIFDDQKQYVIGTIPQISSPELLVFSTGGKEKNYLPEEFYILANFNISMNVNSKIWSNLIQFSSVKFSLMPRFFQSSSSYIPDNSKVLVNLESPPVRFNLLDLREDLAKAQKICKNTDSYSYNLK
ncbi:MAG: hypothetical protein AAGD04_04270 [Pseudomonadota bacterium]